MDTKPILRICGSILLWAFVLGAVVGAQVVHFKGETRWQVILPTLVAFFLTTGILGGLIAGTFSCVYFLLITVPFIIASRDRGEGQTRVFLDQIKFYYWLPILISYSMFDAKFALNGDMILLKIYSFIPVLSSVFLYKKFVQLNPNCKVKWRRWLVLSSIALHGIWYLACWMYLPFLQSAALKH
jgi:hypothetical protein